jgi:hypothetical protein
MGLGVGLPSLALAACCLGAAPLIAPRAAWAGSNGNAANPTNQGSRPPAGATPAMAGAPPQTNPDPNQPYAIDNSGLLPPPCPLIVPAALPALQPIRIQPSQVAAKNRMGCLSAADAFYGPDGCPLKLCAPSSGAFSAPKPR